MPQTENLKAAVPKCFACVEDESANNQWPDIRAENLGVVTRPHATPPTLHVVLALDF